MRNLLFLWNLAHPLFIVSPLLTLAPWTLLKGVRRWTFSQLAVRQMHIILPAFLWYGLFTLQPHKEERFLFVI